MFDESASDLIFPEDEPDQSLQNESSAYDINPSVLMDFLSDFRSAAREKEAAERMESTKPGRQPAASTQAGVVSRFRVGPADPEPWVLDPYVGADRQVEPDWWMAADGRWYMPELHPDAQVHAEPLQSAAVEPVGEPDVQFERPVVEPEVRTPRLRLPRVTRRFA